MKRFALVVAIQALSCQTITEEMPTRPAPAPAAPILVVVVPIPIPTPAPAPQTTPPPQQPQPSSPPQAQGCSLASLPDHGNCVRESPRFLSDVETALDRLVEEHPEYFNLRDGGTCGNCYKVLNVPGYEAGLVRQLQARGLCAVAGEELGVKNTNTFNEQYDVLTSSNYIRRQAGSYQVTCRPAAF